jgi:hypothetical protein
MCYAMAGDNRYHSIFGAIKACVAVNPSDTAPALVALNAKIVTTKQTIDAENFWDVAVPGSTVLAADEIVKEIQIPAPASGVKSAFVKFAIRTSIDFPSSTALRYRGAMPHLPERGYNKPTAPQGRRCHQGADHQRRYRGSRRAAAVSGAWRYRKTSGRYR